MPGSVGKQATARRFISDADRDPSVHVASKKGYGAYREQFEVGS